MCLCSFERQSRRVGVGELNEREKVGVFRESFRCPASVAQQMLGSVSLPRPWAGRDESDFVGLCGLKVYLAWGYDLCSLHHSKISRWLLMAR